MSLWAESGYCRERNEGQQWFKFNSELKCNWIGMAQTYLFLSSMKLYPHWTWCLWWLCMDVLHGKGTKVVPFYGDPLKFGWRPGHMIIFLWIEHDGLILHMCARYSPNFGNGHCCTHVTGMSGEFHVLVTAIIEVSACNSAYFDALIHSTDIYPIRAHSLHSMVDGSRFSRYEFFF